MLGSRAGSKERDEQYRREEDSQDIHHDLAGESSLSTCRLSNSGGRRTDALLERLRQTLRYDSHVMAIPKEWPTCPLTVCMVIPEVVITHVDGAHEDWKKRLRKFCDSGRDLPSLMGRFEPLVAPRRIGSIWGAPRVYGWPEAETALQLEAQGFHCWTGIQLFPLRGRPVYAPEKRRKTLEVEKLMKKHGFALPSTFRSRVSPEPRNPDLVCYHPKSREWRFCEVKRDEAIEPGQLIGLSLLHFLTRAAVCIVRVVPEQRNCQTRQHKISFEISP